MSDIIGTLVWAIWIIALWQPTAPAAHVNQTLVRARPYVDRARRIVRAESCSAGTARNADHAIIAARTVVSAITIIRNSNASACVGPTDSHRSRISVTRPPVDIGHRRWMDGRVGIR